MKILTFFERDCKSWYGSGNIRHVTDIRRAVYARLLERYTPGRLLPHVPAIADTLTRVENRVRVEHDLEPLRFEQGRHSGYWMIP